MIFSKIMGRILRTEPQQSSHDLGHKISNENVPVPRVAPAASVASMRRSPGPADQPGGLVRPVLRRPRDQDHGGHPGTGPARPVGSDPHVSSPVRPCTSTAESRSPDMATMISAAPREQASAGLE